MIDFRVGRCGVRLGRLARWTALAIAAGLTGCLSTVDREAISFPAMPSQAVYHRIDGQQLPPEQAIDALLQAQSRCRNDAQANAAPATVGSPDFDRCMASQGYARSR